MVSGLRNRSWLAGLHARTETVAVAGWHGWLIARAWRRSGCRVAGAFAAKWDGRWQFTARDGSFRGALTIVAAL